MNKIQLGAFAVMFAVLAIVFFLMFVGQGQQSEIGTSMPAITFSIISTVAAVLMLINYVLSGRKQKDKRVQQPPVEPGK
ncbi:hypothetical protein [Yersinia bercovieri]|uniref:hypothetical protein n=1 Tax=Yersinia bercovieri TaxID=634 RepID=UPI0011A19FCC|nr:hypothetical protein [Yersinia bercovieri]